MKQLSKLQTIMEAIKSDFIKKKEVIYKADDLKEMFGWKSAPSIAYYIKDALYTESDSIIIKGEKYYRFWPKMYTREEMADEVNKVALQVRKECDQKLRMSEDDIRDLKRKFKLADRWVSILVVIIILAWIALYLTS